jgi:uncharacterized protein YndB with AHSA1/START domain
MSDFAQGGAVGAASEAERTLTIEHVFRAAPSEVFRAWTDPVVLMQWWGPEGFSAPETHLDLRVGGTWRTRMAGPNGDNIVSGVYREITPPTRLVMTWAWEENGRRGHETVVEVTFEPAGEWTRVRLVQRLFQTAEQAASHKWGWTSSFVDLDKLLAARVNDSRRPR